MSSWHLQEDNFAFTSMYYGDTVETKMKVKFNSLELRRSWCSLQAHLPGSLTFTCDAMPQFGLFIHSTYLFCRDPRAVVYPRRTFIQEVIILPSHLEFLLITPNTASDGVALLLRIWHVLGSKIGSLIWNSAWLKPQLPFPFSCLPGSSILFIPEGRKFNSRWGHWDFSFTQSFRPHCGPGVDSAWNRNEYQEYFLGGKGGQF
jgi:hypothetical protein